MKEFFRKSGPKKDNPEKLFSSKNPMSPLKWFLGPTYFQCTFFLNILSDLKSASNSRFVYARIGLFQEKI